MTNISPIKPSGSKSDKVSLNELQLCMWLGDAAPGDTLEYHRGFLVKDIDTGSKQRLKEPDRTILERLASRARLGGRTRLCPSRPAPDRA